MSAVRNARVSFELSISDAAKQSIYDSFDYYPAVVMSVDGETLDELRSNPSVKGIYENSIHFASLAESTEIVHTNYQRSRVDGTDWSVVILDTGVDKSHSFFNEGGRNKIVSEACYSGGGISDFRIQRLCPGNAAATTATGSGVHCSSYDGCDHGTHVAGIAAGSSANSDGVASGGNIIAMQVFTGLRNLSGRDLQICGESRCLVSFSSDQVKALERVYALRNTFNIASVNMSLGGGRFSGSCAGDRRATASIISRLKSVGIATVISSGNGGFNNALSAPACIPDAIAVGATSDFNGELFGRDFVLDQRVFYSNVGSQLDLYAPGSLILSSVPGNRFENFNGTSMAAPHVAGAFAVIRRAVPDMTVNQIESLFDSVGPIVSSNGVIRKRLELRKALQELGFGPDVVITPFIDLLLED